MIIEINTQSATPIYEQLRNQIVLGIAANKLAPLEALPSVRSLAADLGINYLTVNKAYAMLCDEGYIVIDRRKGAMVAKTIAKDEAALSELARQLTLTAAEAVCRNMSENDFVSLCKNSYKSAKGNPAEGGILS